ncbi:MAG: hypothetical protein ACLUNO_00170 [Oscillospiraceae bacterium]
MDTTGRAPGSIAGAGAAGISHRRGRARLPHVRLSRACSGAAGHRFAVWAPHAQRVALVGDFQQLGHRRDADAPSAGRHMGADRGRSARRGAV